MVLKLWKHRKIMVLLSKSSGLHGLGTSIGRHLDGHFHAICLENLRSGAVDLICVDSVSALTPRAEIEGEIGMQQMGLQACLMSQALHKMSGNASKAGCTRIFLNQIRHKVILINKV
ncbi:hypothetical protein ACSBR2_036102 [Camellia fascicularis]